MFSVLLEFPQFGVVNQEVFDTHYLVHVEKKADEERCTFCGFHSSVIHDRRTRKVRDLSALNKPLFLLVCVKRYRCQNCGEVYSSSFESLNSHQHYTNRFRQFIYEQVLSTTIQDISRKSQIAYSTIERTFYFVAHKKAKDHQALIQEIQDDQDIMLSLDEVAVRKGHKYETVLYDAKLGAVIGMWDPFHKAIQKAFPNAQIIVDKYHVIQKVTQALDQVRKKIPGLKKARFHLLRGYEKVREKHCPRLDDLLETHESLAYGYFLKELFRDFYKSTDYETADQLLMEWLQLAWSSPFPSFHEVAKTVKQVPITPRIHGHNSGSDRHCF